MECQYCGKLSNGAFCTGCGAELLWPVVVDVSTLLPEDIASMQTACSQLIEMFGGRRVILASVPIYLPTSVYGAALA